MGMRAIIRNGTIFLPLNRVSRYCELTTSQRLTPYGTFLRLTNGKESLSTQEFLEVAMGLRPAPEPVQRLYPQLVALRQRSGGHDGSGTDGPARAHAGRG